MENTRLADLDAAWKEREGDASLLRSGGSRSMEISLRLYSLEIRVKAVICRHLRLDSPPKVCKTHDLEELLLFTGQSEQLNDPARVGIKESWMRLAVFSKQRLNDLRYLPDESLSEAEYHDLTRAFDDPTRGVLAWLSGLP